MKTIYIAINLASTGENLSMFMIKLGLDKPVQLSNKLARIMIENLPICKFIYLNHNTRFPAMWYVGPASIRPACALTQSDQSLC